MALSFFANDFITIDIGYKYIKIAQVKKVKNNDLMVINYGIGDTPEECIKNGAINDHEKVINGINRLLRENDLNSKEAKIVISGTNIVTRIIMVDKVEESRLEKKIWEEIHVSLPINLKEHEVDYKVLGSMLIGHEEKLKVFVTAVPKRIISSYINILKKLSLKPIAIDIPANSVSKFFRRDVLQFERTSTAGDTIAVLDMGSETTIVNILKNKIPEFNRVLLMGSSNIDAEIAKVLDLSKSQESKAELYKKTYGMVSNRNPNNDLELQCSEAARAVINQILKNVKMCFDFYTGRCSGEKVDRIYLIGGGAQLKGVTDYFTEILGVPTSMIKLQDVNSVKFAGNLDTEKINYFVNALGIAF